MRLGNFTRFPRVLLRQADLITIFSFRTSVVLLLTIHSRNSDIKVHVATGNRPDDLSTITFENIKHIITMLGFWILLLSRNEE